MKVSIVDLRYKMSGVLRALERNEQVTITYHGKEKGIITPVTCDEQKSVKDLPFFGMRAQSSESVSEAMARLRGARH